MNIENKTIYTKNDLSGVERIAMGTSFDPEKRAESYRLMYVEMMDEFWAFITKLVVDESQIEYAHSQMAAFKEKLITRLNAHISAKSRCISSMITGPARFPVSRANKANDSERNRWLEVEHTISKFEEYTKKNMEKLLPDSVVNSRAVTTMIKEIDKYVNYYIEEPGTAHWIRPNSKGKLLTFIKNNNKESIQSVLHHINTIQADMEKPLWTSLNNIFKTFEEALNKPDVVEVEENEALLKNSHIEVVNNIEAERVQLLFEGKPSEEIRTLLKSHGFRWSPRFGAWQRKNTNNGLYWAKACFKDASRLIRDDLIDHDQ